MRGIYLKDASKRWKASIAVAVATSTNGAGVREPFAEQRCPQAQRHAVANAGNIIESRQTAAAAYVTLRQMNGFVVRVCDCEPIRRPLQKHSSVLNRVGRG